MTVYQSGGVPRSFLAFTVSLVCFSLPLFPRHARYSGYKQVAKVLETL